MEKMTCKLRPDTSLCASCLSAQVKAGQVFDCTRCPNNKNNRYEILAFGVGFLGTKVVILKEGQPEVVPMWKCYEIERDDIPNS